MTARALLQGHVRAGSWFADRRGPRERRPDRRRRAPDHRRRRLEDPVLDAGRARDRVAQAVPPVRAAALVRRQHEGPARRRRVGPRGGARRRRHPRPAAARRGRGRREPGQDRRRARPAGQPEQRGAGHRHAHPGRPAGAHPGLVRHRPADLAGHRRLDADTRAARRAPDLDRGRRQAGHRRRHRRRGLARGVPRRPAPLPADHAARRRSGLAAPGHRCAPRGRHARDRLRGRPGRRARARDVGRPRHRRGAHLRRRVGDPARLRPDHLLDRRGRRPRRADVDEAPAAALGRHGVPLGRLADRRRGGQPAEPRAAADHGPAGAAARLHHPRRPRELPHPQPARPARVGVDHRPGPDRRVHDRRVRHRRRCCAARTSSSTRSRSSAARRAPTRPRPRRTSASSAPRARPTSCASTATPCSRRR